MRQPIEPHARSDGNSSTTTIWSSPPARSSRSTKCRGSGPRVLRNRSARTSTQPHAWESYQEFLENPGPIIVGAAAGASCFGPAYEFAMILDADLRKRKLRDRVPMTFVTSEPYIGHMGLGGVGDSKGLMESRTAAAAHQVDHEREVTASTAGEMNVAEHDDEGKPKKEHALPFSLQHGHSGVQRRGCRGRGAGAVQSARLRADRRAPALAEVSEHLLGRRVRRDSAGRGDAGAHRRAQDRLHDRIDGQRDLRNIAAEIAGQARDARATWNAICLADFGDTGAAFVALPEIPPRNVTWAKAGKWVHLAKSAFEKYFLRKVRTGSSHPVYEKYVLKALGIELLK